MKRIVTHSKPDADAIAAAWLAENFPFQSEDVAVMFVSHRLPGQFRPATDSFVEVGCIQTPARRHFDHKPPAFAKPRPKPSRQLVTGTDKTAMHEAALVVPAEESGGRVMFVGTRLLGLGLTRSARFLIDRRLSVLRSKERRGRPSCR